jgi:diguanylate cyclase (GGDEF)-like protein
MNKIRKRVKTVLERDRFVEEHLSAANFDARLYLQIVVSIAFFILSITNIVSKSYFMLLLTLAGCIINGVSAFCAKKAGKGRACAILCIVTCSLLFAYFVIYGGNDGFACLWVILLPFLAMVAMDFVVGFCASAFFQIFLIVVFWTPVREMLCYQYNEQFCLRFPLFFLVTFLLGLALTLSLKKSQYNECRQLLKLEEMTESAHKLARLDSLTNLFNRRGAYEEFDANFSQQGVAHCLVMCDIDHFKTVNDTYGHEYGDEVLNILADLFREELPPDYLMARWGGEEFLFAANEPLDEVYQKIEKLRNTISLHKFHAGNVPVHITLTFGIAEYADGKGVFEAINVADSRLYKGKAARRNCTVIQD